MHNRKSKIQNPKSASAVRCAWVLSGAPIEELPVIPAWLPQPDKVLAADGGSMLAVRLGVLPDLVVGDFDSIDPALLAEWRDLGVQFAAYEHHLKAETDTELAVLAALQWHPQYLVVLGAIGGRLDHTFANVLLLTHPALSAAQVVIVEGEQYIFLARPGTWNDISGRKGDTMTLLPIGGDAVGVTLEGLEYPLDKETLLRGRGRGVSNVLSADTGRVWLDSGQLLVVVTGREVRNQDFRSKERLQVFSF